MTRMPPEAVPSSSRIRSQMAYSPGATSRALRRSVTKEKRMETPRVTASQFIARFIAGFDSLLGSKQSGRRQVRLRVNPRGARAGGRRLC